MSQWLDQDCMDRFDVIAFCDSLIYFGDLDQLLPCAAQRLVPGGALAFTARQARSIPMV
jgi:predicted TPR repeat methyltransferase